MERVVENILTGDWQTMTDNNMKSLMLSGKEFAI